MPTSSGKLDLRGEVCPYTFIRARLKLETMAIDDTLDILVDHAPALNNLPKSLREWGQEVDEIAGAGADGPWVISVHKRAP